MKSTFEGWYYKQQADSRTLALIPEKAGDGAFIQVITERESFNIPFDLSKYWRDSVLKVGDNEFSNSGVKLNIKRGDISLYGELQYRNLTPIKGDIMGPFRFFPMECRHGIISMKHDASGEIMLNGERLDFDGGIGYIETDSGRSFPEGYSWIHSNDFDDNCSIMASIAKIPFTGLSFWGCIAVVWLDGREYRLATYKGAKMLRCEQGIMEIAQGKYHLSVKVAQNTVHNLAAPQSGAMSRVIRESASCPAKFVFTDGDRIIFSGESNHTSYEYVMD